MVSLLLGAGGRLIEKTKPVTMCNRLCLNKRFAYLVQQEFP